MNTADQKRFHSERLREGGHRLWRGMRESCRSGGRAYLVSGGPASGTTELLGELVTQARNARIRVITASARVENARGEAFAAKIIRDLESDCFGMDGIGDKIAAESIQDRSRVQIALESLSSSLGNKANLADYSNFVDRLRATLERAA